jgi:hypothetical protein
VSEERNTDDLCLLARHAKELIRLARPGMRGGELDALAIKVAEALERFGRALTETHHLPGIEPLTSQAYQDFETDMRSLQDWFQAYQRRKAG